MSWLSALTGVHLSPKGFHIDPKTILTNAMAMTGNPWAIAGSIGNAVHAVSPNSTLGHLGDTAETVGSIGGGLTGGLRGIGSLPGMSSVGNVLSSIPGASQVGSMLGIGGAGNGAVDGAIPDSAMGLPSSGGGFGGIVSKLGGSGGWDLNKILQAASGAEGVYNTLQANKYRGQAIDLAKQQNAAAAPLRSAAQAKLLNSQPPDLTSVYQNAQNPFSPTYRSLQ